MLTDDKAEAMGVELLHFFSLLWSPKVTDINALTDQESKALEFIRRMLDTEQRPPSVREVARAIGLKSSRSGFRVVQRLIAKGVMMPLHKKTFKV
jgi:SOS-response transcriptional repressor LexA